MQWAGQKTKESQEHKNTIAKQKFNLSVKNIKLRKSRDGKYKKKYFLKIKGLTEECTSN